MRILYFSNAPSVTTVWGKTPILRPKARKASRYLRQVVDLFAYALPQDDEHRHGHLHVALLGVVAEHLAHDGAEEAGGQVGREERLRDGDEREGLDGRQARDFGLVAADVRRVGLVLLEVLGGRRVVQDVVAQLEGFLGERALLLLCRRS